MTRKYKRLEELEIWDDFMFGAVMSNKELCKHLLEIILQKKIKAALAKAIFAPIVKILPKLVQIPHIQPPRQKIIRQMSIEAYFSPRIFA